MHMMMRNPAQMLFLFTTAILAYLVLPPFFFILHTSLVTDRGLQAGSFTIQHFINIVDSLGDVKTLLSNSLIYAVEQLRRCLGLRHGARLARRAQRRSISQTRLYLSLCVVRDSRHHQSCRLDHAARPQSRNAKCVGMALIGQPFFNIFSMSGMILVESFLWIPIVFLLMSTPFRSMDPSLEEAATTAGSSGWQVFRRVTFPLAVPSVLAVMILTMIRSLEAFEIPALIGIPAGVEVLTTKIYLQIKGGLIPKYGEASAYSIILIVLVALGLIPYYRITSKTYKFTTISGKNFRPNRVALGKWRWLGGLLMLVLPLLQFLPIVAIAWSSFLAFRSGAVAQGAFNC